MSFLKKVFSPMIGVIHSGLKFERGSKDNTQNTPQKQSTTHYSCMFELHEYNKRKALLQNSKIEE